MKLKIVDDFTGEDVIVLSQKDYNILEEKLNKTNKELKELKKELDETTKDIYGQLNMKILGVQESIISLQESQIKTNETVWEKLASVFNIQKRIKKTDITLED